MDLLRHGCCLSGMTSRSSVEHFPKLTVKNTEFDVVLLVGYDMWKY